MQPGDLNGKLGEGRAHIPVESLETFTTTVGHCLYWQLLPAFLPAVWAD